MSRSELHPIYPANATLIPNTFTHQHPHATTVKRTVGAMLGPKLPQRPSISARAHRNAEKHRLEEAREAYENRRASSPYSESPVNSPRTASSASRNKKSPNVGRRRSLGAPQRLPSTEEYETPMNVSPFAIVAGRTRAAQHHNHYTNRAYGQSRAGDTKTRYFDPQNDSWEAKERRPKSLPRSGSGRKKKGTRSGTPASSRASRSRTPSYLRPTTSSRNHSQSSNKSDTGARYRRANQNRANPVYRQSNPLPSPQPDTRTYVMAALEERNVSLGQQLKEMKSLLLKMGTPRDGHDKKQVTERRRQKQPKHRTSSVELRRTSATSNDPYLQPKGIIRSSHPPSPASASSYRYEDLQRQLLERQNSQSADPNLASGAPNSSAQHPTKHISSDNKHREAQTFNASSPSTASSTSDGAVPSRVDLSTIGAASSASAFNNSFGIHVPTAAKRVNGISGAAARQQQQEDYSLDSARAVEKLLLQSMHTGDKQRGSSKASVTQSKWEDSPSMKQLNSSAEQKVWSSNSHSDRMSSSRIEIIRGGNLPSRSQTFQQQQEAYWMQSRSLISQLEKAIKKSCDK